MEIENLYQQYLRKVSLTESEMPEIQKTETRRAFFGGMSEMLVYMTQRVSELSEEEGVKEIDNLYKQIQEFWMEESK